MLPDDPPLTRKVHDNPHQQGWDVYYGDIRIGHIGTRAGVPIAEDQWAWTLGFHPGTEVANAGGDGASFEDCRAAFERAWLKLKPTLTVADYDRWRDDRDWTAWKYRMWADKLLLPTQTREDRSRCFCGADIRSADLMDHVRASHRGIGAK